MQTQIDIYPCSQFSDFSLSQVESAISLTEKDGLSRCLYSQISSRGIYELIPFLLITKENRRLSPESAYFLSFLKTEPGSGAQPPLIRFPESAERIDAPSSRLNLCLGVRTGKQALSYHNTTFKFRILNEDLTLFLQGQNQILTNNLSLDMTQLEIKALRQSFERSGIFRLSYEAYSLFPEMNNLIATSILEYREELESLNEKIENQSSEIKKSFAETVETLIKKNYLQELAHLSLRSKMAEEKLSSTLAENLRYKHEIELLRKKLDEPPSKKARN